jgi:hypothetical protein
MCASSQSHSREPVHKPHIRDIYLSETKMSHKEDYDDDAINESEMARTFQFDKFVQDLERRESIRRDAAQQVSREHNELNRLRDERNREHLYSRLRWSR